MVGLMLANQLNIVAGKDGKIIEGPVEDKKWLRETIASKVVVVGKTTWDKDISKYPKLVEQALLWLVLTTKAYQPAGHINVKFVSAKELKIYKVKYCLGGPKTIEILKPDRLIIHRVVDKTTKGTKINLEDYLLTKCRRRDSYTQEYYDLIKDKNAKA